MRRAIRTNLIAHLNHLGLHLGANGDDSVTHYTKSDIRDSHAPQRYAYHKKEEEFLREWGQPLIDKYFADGSEVDPARLQPLLVPVDSGTEEARVFRLATMLWSVPVSKGYGRRMRFIIIDKSNGKLVGIFGLTDPVFNLRARDEWIGWNADDRKARLVNLMDAHVVGAVPPYNMLLGGKLVASLMTSLEVCDAFRQRYSQSRGIISGKKKRAQLVLLTVTSALGRSSLYNRLRLPNLLEFRLIGRTQGWGHFQVPDDLFTKMRALLEADGHSYASGHQYGQGPNWRMRVVREALTQVGLSADLLKHGISREIYAAPLVDNWREFLLGSLKKCLVNRPTVDEISHHALCRWVLPRSQRRPEYRTWTRSQTWTSIVGNTAIP